MVIYLLKNWIMKKLSILAICILSFIGSTILAQDSKLYLIKNKDTVSQIDVKILLELPNKTIQLNQGNKLVYPAGIALDSINSLLVVYKDDTISFFNIKKMKESGKFSKSFLRNMIPDFKELIKTKANMYFTIDTYPFDTESRKEMAKLNEKKTYKKLHILELVYQAKSTRIYKPKG